MSISSKVSSTTSAISEINTDNLDSQKPRATSAAEGIRSEGERIASLARDAQGNDSTITQDVAKTRTELETIARVKDTFITIVTQIQRDLQEAQARFAASLTTAEETFNQAFSDAQNELSSNISSIETTNESNKSLHREIESIAS